MSGLRVCRICLSSNINMYPIANTPLQDIYEKLTSYQLHNNDRPAVICYICQSQLRSCLRLKKISELSEEVYTQLLATEFELTEETLMILNKRKLQNLSVVSLEAFNIIDNPVNGVKVDLEEMPDEIISQDEIKSVDEDFIDTKDFIEIVENVEIIDTEDTPTPEKKFNITNKEISELSLLEEKVITNRENDRDRCQVSSLLSTHISEESDNITEKRKFEVIETSEKTHKNKAIKSLNFRNIDKTSRDGSLILKFNLNHTISYTKKTYKNVYNGNNGENELNPIRG